MPEPWSVLDDGRPHSGARLLALLLPVPFLLAAHQLHQRGTALLVSHRWDVDVDRAWIEVLGYVYVVAAACVLAVHARDRRDAPVYAAWVLALLVLVCDDALAVHEHGGAWLDRRLPLPDPPGLRSQDVGELLVWAALGVPVLLALWRGHRASPPEARRDSRRLAAPLGLLVVFAVGLDMVHIASLAVTTSSTVDTVLISLEAAGELGAVAGLLHRVAQVVRHQRTGPAVAVGELRRRTRPVARLPRTRLTQRPAAADAWVPRGQRY